MRHSYQQGAPHSARFCYIIYSMNIVERFNPTRYKNLLKNYRKEMLKNATLEKLYREACLEHTSEIQALNVRFAELTKI